jgi:hypothetical protein
MAGKGALDRQIAGCYARFMPESRAARKLPWLLAVGLALGIGVGWFAPRLFPRAEEPKPLPDVISQVRELSRLEGVSYHIERVVDLKDKQQSMFGLVESEDAILLVASGDVVAGVDLGKLQPDDVVVSPDRRSVTIKLPHAEIFSARLDNDRTFVHTRKTDLMAKRKESLETEARQAAEKTLRSAAEEGGIVKRADESVARTVRALVGSLGFETVKVDFRDGA